MNILIFGASGATGHELVTQSLEKGYDVTAFVRNPEKLTITHERLNVVQGDVKDYAAVEAAAFGKDAVLSALGVSKPLNSDPAVVEGIKNIVAALEKSGPKRFVYLSFIGVGDSGRSAGFMVKYILPKILKHEIADHELKESLIRNSRLDWTFVRPPKLTAGPARGTYRSGEDISTTAFLPTMSRADVAGFMVDQLAEQRYVRKVVRVLY